MSFIPGVDHTVSQSFKIYGIKNHLYFLLPKDLCKIVFEYCANNEYDEMEIKYQVMCHVMGDLMREYFSLQRDYGIMLDSYHGICDDWEQFERKYENVNSIRTFVRLYTQNDKEKFDDLRTEITYSPIKYVKYKRNRFE